MFNFFKKRPYYIIKLAEETGVPPIPVYDRKIMIGRANNHVLVIPDASISRNHIEVSFNKEGQLHVTDLGTANGTKIDGQPIPANIPVPYAEGNVVLLGQSDFAIRFEIYREE